MVKAKEFWETICNKLDYRFFSGLPVSTFKSIYAAMDPEIMHYVPAANEQIALNSSFGACLSGFKSATILPNDRISLLDFSLVKQSKTPTLIITDKKIITPTIISSECRSMRGVESFIKKVEVESCLGVLVIPKGGLK